MTACDPKETLAPVAKSVMRRRFLGYSLAFVGGSAATFAGLKLIPEYRRIKDVQWTGRRVIDVDISRLKPGELVTETVDYMPVHILKSQHTAKGGFRLRGLRL